MTSAKAQATFSNKFDFRFHFRLPPRTARLPLAKGRFSGVVVKQSRAKKKSSFKARLLLRIYKVVKESYTVLTVHKGRVVTAYKLRARIERNGAPRHSTLSRLNRTTTTLRAAIRRPAFTVYAN